MNLNLRALVLIYWAKRADIIRRTATMHETFDWTKRFADKKTEKKRGKKRASRSCSIEKSRWTQYSQKTGEKRENASAHRKHGWRGYLKKTSKEKSRPSYAHYQSTGTRGNCRRKNKQDDPRKDRREKEIRRNRCMTCYFQSAYI